MKKIKISFVRNLIMHMKSHSILIQFWFRPQRKKKYLRIACELVNMSWKNIDLAYFD